MLPMHRRNFLKAAGALSAGGLLAPSGLRAQPGADVSSGAVGDLHSHTHSQVSYVQSGEFDVSIDGVDTRLGPGDSFYVAPNLRHGAVCRKAGVLIDVFSPVRDDFLGEDKA